MKILKRLLIAVVIIIAVPLIIALFVKKEYTVEREITISKPREEVFEYIKYLKHQDNYNKWVMKDPAMKKEYRGTDGTAGFVYSWNGNDDAGEGEQEIKKIVEGQRVDSEIRFKRPFENTANAYMITTSLSEGQTKLTWGMEGSTPYPLNIMNLFIDNLLGKDLQTSLTTLKGIIEK